MARTTHRRESRVDMTLTNILLGLVAALLVAAVALLAVGMGQSPPNANTRWQYHITSPDDILFDAEMTRLGAEGWELVTARRATGQSDSVSYEMIFKRPIQ